MNYLLALFLTLIAVLFSFLFGKWMSNSWYQTSLWLSLFPILYLLLGRYINYLKIKNLKKVQGVRLGKVVIEHKKEFYHSIHSLYFAAFFTFLIYLILYFIFDVGKSI